MGPQKNNNTRIMNTLHVLHSRPPETRHQPCLREITAQVVRRYLQDMDGTASNDLHACVLAEVEPALLAEVLAYSQGNQSKAAEILGINRATLRKKLQHYGIRTE